LLIADWSEGLDDSWFSGVLELIDGDKAVDLEILRIDRGREDPDGD
jgi:hypothetical protein